MFTKIIKKIKKCLKKIKKCLFFLLPLVLLVSFTLAFIQISCVGKICSGIYVSDIYVGNQNEQTALNSLNTSIGYLDSVNLHYQEETYQIPLNEIDFQYNLEKTVQKAYNYTRTGNFFYDIPKKISLIFKKEKLGIEFSLNEDNLKNKIVILTKNLEVKPINPKVSLDKGNINIEKGQKGKILDYLLLRSEIGKNLAFQDTSVIEIPFEDSGYILNEIEIETLEDRAKKLIDKEIELSFDENKYILSDTILVSFLNPQGDYFDDLIQNQIDEISSTINRESQNSVFVFEEGKVKEFTPSLNGYTVDKEKLKTAIVGNLRTLEQDEKDKISLDIPVTITEPKIQNKDVNNLGIETLLGRGSSKFVGSIANRIYNIGLASSKFKGVLIAPGENLSFNQILGDVSQETGFRQAYIIKEGKTVLGDGGGVCQVSTTLFRAALNAGLPILERQAHAYRVGYYEQDSSPGLDATVYSPHPDLIIKNDTSKHILVQSIFNEQKRTLVFEIYGTDDGRVSLVSKPIITDVTQPPEDLYIDDATLPTGTIKQIEYKAWGAKIRFDYTVKKNGEIIYKKTFYSNYQPWQAVFLKGIMQQ